ncbi:MAG TPA: amidohydrolase family protein [Kofleriaceae bacterium]
MRATLLLLAACGGSSAVIDAPERDRDATIPDVAIDAPDAPPPDAPPDGPTIMVGAPDRILLLGTVVTPATTFDGAVLVEGNLITCVDTAALCSAMPGAAGATVIETAGVIAPGLVDTHNHILFDIFDGDDWLPSQLYMDHDQWTAEPAYAAMLDTKQCLVDDSQGKPAWCDQTPYGTAAGSLRCEVDKYGELKGLVAGTTSIVGLPGTSAACFGSLARSIDVAQNGLGADHIQTSATFPPSDPNGVCGNFAAGTTHAFLVHVGEGDDPHAAGELARLGTASEPDGCLYAPQTTITHGVAFTQADFQQMAAAGMKLTWSPQSNVSLYGVTADIPTALDAGVLVALGPDWSMGGSIDMLDELRFAQMWDATHWQRLSSQDLVTMATVNGAKVLALDDQLGSLAPNMLADITVFAGDRAHPYDAIIAAHPSDVRLVMVGGVPLYGDAVLGAAGPAVPGCEALDVCGNAKFLCVATDSTASKLDQTLGDITTAISDALTLADTLTPDDGYNFSPIAPLFACP